MKFLSTLLLLTFGLSFINGQPFNQQDSDTADKNYIKNAPWIEEGVREVLTRDFKIIDLDDALKKHRILRNLTLLISQSDDDAGDSRIRKRSIGSFFKAFEEDIEYAVGKVENYVQDKFVKAKHAFEAVVHSAVDFDTAVHNLITFLEYEMTVGACESVCVMMARPVLGIAAPLVDIVANPLCEAALAQFEKLVG